MCDARAELLREDWVATELFRAPEQRPIEELPDALLVIPLQWFRVDERAEKRRRSDIKINRRSVKGDD